jgi:hypothetical protein
MLPIKPKQVRVHIKGTDSIRGLVQNPMTVKPAFAVDAENPRTNESARAWATSTNRHGYAGPGPGERLIPNKGFLLQIVDLESRGEGGRAYKVIDQFGHYFDLREETIVDVLAHVGIHAGGEIPCSFTWVRRGSQLRLVREGSKEDLAAMETDGANNV